ncbi:RagB/SusD family nutrient uptake outer membrane protein [uncultured Phocaeicola sp.]|uniref:RagB/SusD family nutrient uptake outer membrane protein n=1 Tax=uncultured Phocaeicola sp. TaxID=990718 RepID=UPI0030C6EBB6
MKKINQYKLLAGICALSFLSSCDYEDINTNPYEMTDEMGKMDGIAMGGPILSMERHVVPVGTQADGTKYINEYQTAYHLSADLWSGYFSENNNWDSGNNHMTYFLKDPWVSSTYKNSYTNVFAPWKEAKIESEKNGDTNGFALAQILKISAWVKTLETFGPIPYIHAGEMALVIPFDSEEEVYDAMFSDLQNAITTLTPLAEQGGTVVADFDAVYAGSANKWVKYANSLMLRLAMRLRFVAPEKAKQWAQTALEHSVGVMEVKDDEAQMSVGAGYTFVSNIAYLAANYNEARMCTSMYAYLAGYEDPRLSKYFSPSKTKGALSAFDGETYAPVPPGHVQGNDTYKEYSQPNMTSATPNYWMRASEVYFLRAEAALAWPEFGDAESLYKQGVQMSFEENGLSASEVDTYLASGKKPVAVEIAGYSAPVPTQATTEFSGNNEEKLEKIMIQKWIALYPNGQEAWTEWRRTGYPKLNQVQINNGAGQGITKEDGIRRMVYPISFSQSAEDKANYDDAVSKLKDKVDKATSRLWWDAKN